MHESENLSPFFSNISYTTNMIGMGILFNDVENSSQEKSVDPIVYYEYNEFQKYILSCIKRGRQTRQIMMGKL